MQPNNLKKSFREARTSPDISERLFGTNKERRRSTYTTPFPLNRKELGEIKIINLQRAQSSGVPQEWKVTCTCSGISWRKKFCRY